MSRSALDRMLRRHGVSTLPKAPEAEATPSKAFKAYEPGFVHLDISAERFLRALHEAAPFTIHTILTDNAKAFTDRFPANGQRQPTGTHGFDQGRTEFGIEHRLIPPGRPQTNGMVERFNGRIAEVLRTPQFRSSRDDLDTTLKRCVWLYNQHLPQKAISHRTPTQTMKDWQAHKPAIFKKPVRNHPGPDR